MGKVSEVILVDNARPERIGPFKVLVGRVPFWVFDHHPRAPGDVPAVGGRVQEVGATVSLLLPLLKERGLALTPLEATLAYAGVWEDTGGFSFPSTTPLDLGGRPPPGPHGGGDPPGQGLGAPPPGEEARSVLKELLKTARVVEVEGFRLLLARAKEEGYVPALAPLAHTLWTCTRRTGCSWCSGWARRFSSSPGARRAWTWPAGSPRWEAGASPGGLRPGKGVRGALHRLLSSLFLFLDPEPTLGRP